MTDLVPISMEHAPTDLALTELENEARGYVEASRSASTMRAYASDWRAFTAWCAARGVIELPADPNTVVLYLTDLARHAKTATIRRRISSISVAHQAQVSPLRPPTSLYGPPGRGSEEGTEQRRPGRP